jgi:hypothetical protein
MNISQHPNRIVAGNGITNNFAISTSASLVSLGYKQYLPFAPD